MKVKREEAEPRFEPITITLETVDELRAVYVSVCVHSGTTLEDWYQGARACWNPNRLNLVRGQLENALHPLVKELQ